MAMYRVCEANSGTWLRLMDDFRTLRWIDEVKCPEIVIKQVKEF